MKPILLSFAILTSAASTAATALGAEPAALPERIGFYQWASVGAPNDSNDADDSADLLTEGRRRSTATGARVFRLYVGARFDYIYRVLSPLRFGAAHSRRPLTPAWILSIPRYRAVLEDPAIDTVVLTVYPVAEYGAGEDDVNLLRPWGDAEQAMERRQTAELCRFLYDEFGDLDKTVIIVNNEADEKLLEIANYTGSPQLAVDNLRRWTQTRFETIRQERRRHPQAKLRLLHAFEISLVNLLIAPAGQGFRKTPATEIDEGAPGWNALRDVVPHVSFDLLSYSSYESTNSPFENSHDPDVAPRDTALRLKRDIEIIRRRAAGSLSPTGRREFRRNFVMIGELGYARDRFEHLPTGGVLPRLYHALRAATAVGCPYVVLWQVFDSPRLGGDVWGFGAYDRLGRTPKLKAPPGGCDSIVACLELLFEQGFDAWAQANGYGKL